MFFTSLIKSSTLGPVFSADKDLKKWKNSETGKMVEKKVTRNFLTSHKRQRITKI